MKKYLIVGLGNIGDKYDYTRHNIGFECVDALAEKNKATFKPVNFGHMATFKYRGRPVFILKPDTFMNLSGNAVHFWMKKEKITAREIIIITDDLNLEMGTLRLKGKGSDGGHNGLKHIQATLGHQNYPRIRFGIGNKYEQGRQVDFVLGKWTDQEAEKLPTLTRSVIKGIELFMFQGIGPAMNFLNTKPKPKKETQESENEPDVG